MHDPTGKSSGIHTPGGRPIKSGAARNRDSALGGQLDLGGGYVHWAQPNVWTEVERHGLEQLNPPLESTTYYQLADDEVHTDKFELTHELVGKLFADSRQRFPMPFNINAVDNSDINEETLEERIASLGLSTRDSDLIKGALSGLVHNYSKHGSTQLLFAVSSNFGNYAAELETASNWCITGGMKKLTDAIQRNSKAKLQLSTAIKRVTDDGKQVTLTTASGDKLYAKTAVVAVPINTLRHINISPALPPSVSKMLSDGNPVRGSKLWVVPERDLGQVERVVAVGERGRHGCGGLVRRGVVDA
ncbi:hypothetical protein NLG97_g5217 [Lecanicillium saksenae]|uniref:Uncharacterized protein n=1 Tax=Lecanicillium saksenae TaxID=468837 RepID=A0ACC1QWB1_9HYPO|nr:hypothetical protein NLG97_g5217 [Lecanicillium saksenae]